MQNTIGTEKLKILLMEDELLIQDLVKEGLKLFGYILETTDNGPDALILYKDALAAGNPYHLVILDIYVPGGMDGIDTMKNISAMHPQAKGILVSGHSAHPALPAYGSYGFSGRILKPFTIPDLHSIIIEVMLQK